MTASRRDPYDALAAMFMTDDDPVGRPDSEEDGEHRGRTVTTLEALVVGHLPVRASLWLAPVAAVVARGAGPTALVRLEGEHPVLQLFGTDTVPEPLRTARTLREAIAGLDGVVHHWLVRLADAADPLEIVHLDPDRVTVLGSGDQVAIVSAYQHIKDVVEAADEDELDPPPCAVAMIGVEDDAARDATDRLDRTTRDCLEVGVELRFCLPRLEPGLAAMTTLDFAGQPIPAAETLAAWIRGEPAAHDEPFVDESPVVEVASPAPAPAPAPEPVASATSDPRPDPLEHPVRTRTVRVFPKPVPAARVEVEAKAPNAPVEPDDAGRPVPLASHVEGLIPIEPRCPDHEHVELAVDRSGRLHVLGRVHDLREIIVVEAWARKHAALLAMAARDVTLDARRAPERHVVSDDPLAVADLHGSDWHLHVLAPVDVAGRRGWYSAPLARPGGARTAVAPGG